MSIPPVSPGSGPDSPLPLGTSRPPGSEPARVFEQLLVRQFLRETRIAGNLGGTQTQQSIVSDLVVDAVAQSVGEGGGMGIEAALRRQLNLASHASAEPIAKPH